MTQSAVPQIVLDGSTEAQKLAQETLALIARIYEGREDYRLVGGQMVMLLQTLYPLDSQPYPRFTLDTDAALGDPDIPQDHNRVVLELLTLADDELTKAGFHAVGGSAYVREGAEGQQEVNFLQASARRQNPGPIQPEIVPNSPEGSCRQVDALPELTYVLRTNPLKIRVHLSVLDDVVTVCLPPLEQAITLKVFAVRNRGYLDKDVKDLLTLLRIRDGYPQIPWELNGDGLIGWRRDTAQALRKVSTYLRRNDVPGLSRDDKEELRLLISTHVAPEAL